MFMKFIPNIVEKLSCRFALLTECTDFVPILGGTIRIILLSMSQLNTGETFPYLFTVPAVTVAGFGDFYWFMAS